MKTLTILVLVISRMDRSPIRPSALRNKSNNTALTARFKKPELVWES